MGYYTRPGMVDEQVPLLSAILSTVQAGETLRLKVEPASALGSEHYKLRRLLKATELNTDEAEGQFAGLGRAVRLTTEISDDGAYLVIRGKGSKFQVAEAASLDVQLAILDSYAGDITLLKFPRRVNEQELLAKAAQRGWEVALDTKQEFPSGEVWYAASRMDQRRPADAYSQFGFGGSKS